ncbi:ABC transporter substrate-binding protein [Hoyosella rhizosphaerae]|uniref:ABC transporter substrate-binding protein n=1 Tax=Hoyosella rhizosphaerae TaxID=1755582 RepID=A0A916U7X4_9ACTN|nr:ABC transporter substrate-binding protein [Hoyosella rhizosphaerae]MBN4927609.1 ABC transporter substrate-binding protein [Hoyosella rhizosphaerae]GGC63117.1 ABC transporter substrate-binding protein [Hoyosella rhizosphaerae]
MTTRNFAYPKVGALIAAAITIAGCSTSDNNSGDGSAAAGETTTRENCGIDVAVTEPPQRIYAAYQPAIEVAHSLGVSDRLIGTAYLDAQVLPEYADAQATVDYVESLPSRDELLGENPDFVLSGFNGVFSETASSSVGTRASLSALGVQTWILSPLCPSADGLADAAIDPASVRIENIYSDLRDLGALWDVEENAEAVIAELTARFEALANAVGDAEKPRIAVVTPRADGTLSIASGTDFVTQIINAAGGVNVFEDLTELRNIQISEEELIQRNPDIILTSKCCDASYTDDDALPDVETIRTNPALANIDAVRNNQVYPFLFADRAAGVRAAHAAEKIAALIHPDLVSE